MALSSGYTYLAVCLARQWIKERGIIDMRVRVKVVLCWRTDIRRWRIAYSLYGLSFKINIELTGTVLLCVYISVYLYLVVVGSKVNGSTCIFSCILLNISVLE